MSKAQLLANGRGVFILDEVSHIRPATPAEIMDAHPVCRDCKHSTRWLCANPFAAEGQQGHVIDTDTHYCRHWKAKE